MPAMTPFARRVVTCAAAAFALQAPLAHAGMLPAEAAAQSASEQERARVRDFLERGAVQDRLQERGVGTADARARVDAMSEQEVHALAERIDSLPAGGALSDRDIILVLLVTLLLIVVL